MKSQLHKQHEYKDVQTNFKNTSNSLEEPQAGKGYRSSNEGRVNHQQSSPLVCSFITEIYLTFGICLEEKPLYFVKVSAKNEKTSCKGSFCRKILYTGLVRRLLKNLLYNLINFGTDPKRTSTYSNNAENWKVESIERV